MNVPSIMETAHKCVTTLLEAMCARVALVICSVLITDPAVVCVSKYLRSCIMDLPILPQRSMSVLSITETALSYVPIQMEVISVPVILAMY